MNPRFPPIAKIKQNLLYPTGPLMSASLSGALSSYYGIATDEFEQLRYLAKAAVEGDPDDRERLEKYLREVDATADLYAKMGDRIELPA